MRWAQTEERDRFRDHGIRSQSEGDEEVEKMRIFRWVQTEEPVHLWVASRNAVAWAG